MKARIYQPSRSAMQSGMGKTHDWVLEYESDSAKAPDPLMGWTESNDTMHQIRMKFGTLESAQAFAQEQGLDVFVLPPRRKRIKPRNYGDNFRYIPPKEE
ncbi:ETC complex I subunit [Alphaproteobacteria bacterium]|nr:ETC complex I subunit [Alphaproteobacteria bacterium]